MPIRPGFLNNGLKRLLKSSQSLLVRRRISCCDLDSERCEHLLNARHRSSRIEECLDSGREDRGLFRPTRVARSFGNDVLASGRGAGRLRKLSRQTAGDNSFISRSQSEEPHNKTLQPQAARHGIPESPQFCSRGLRLNVGPLGDAKIGPIARELPNIGYRGPADPAASTWASRRTLQPETRVPGPLQFDGQTQSRQAHCLPTR